MEKWGQDSDSKWKTCKCSGANKNMKKEWTFRQRFSSAKYRGQEAALVPENSPEKGKAKQFHMQRDILFFTERMGKARYVPMHAGFGLAEHKNMNIISPALTEKSKSRIRLLMESEKVKEQSGIRGKTEKNETRSAAFIFLQKRNMTGRKNKFPEIPYWFDSVSSKVHV